MATERKLTWMEKARKKLGDVLPSKKPLSDYTMDSDDEDSMFAGTTKATVSKINKRRKALEDTLNY